MKRLIDVHKGEETAGRGDVVLKSDIRDTSCFVIVARDAAHKIGALAHAMFVTGGLKEKKDPVLAKEAKEAIDKMLSNMTLLGAAEKDIEVELVAGENVKHEGHDPEFNEEINRIHDILKDRHIKCRDEAVADLGSKHVALDVDSGKISYT